MNIYITESLCCTLKLKHHCKLTILQYIYIYFNLKRRKKWDEGETVETIPGRGNEGSIGVKVYF